MVSVWPGVVPQGKLGHRADGRGRRADGLEWSVHPPTPYISCYWSQILPSWSEPVASVLLLLQQAPLPLIARSEQAEISKVQLRDRALALGQSVSVALNQRGHRTALFDPKTGLPVTGAQGKPLDDVAVVQALLGYQAVREGSCTCIFHPSWGFAVYPTTLLCAAAPKQIEVAAAGQVARP